MAKITSRKKHENSNQDQEQEQFVLSVLRFQARGKIPATEIKDFGYALDGMKK